MHVLGRNSDVHLDSDSDCVDMQCRNAMRCESNLKAVLDSPASSGFDCGVDDPLKG